MALSDTWLKANNGKERGALEERGDREGLGVRVTPKGKITFQLRYRFDGRPKRLDLGSYPLMSLKDERRFLCSTTPKPYAAGHSFCRFSRTGWAPWPPGF